MSESIGEEATDVREEEASKNELLNAGGQRREVGCELTIKNLERGFEGCVLELEERRLLKSDDELLSSMASRRIAKKREVEHTCETEGEKFGIVVEPRALTVTNGVCTSERVLAASVSVTGFFLLAIKAATLSRSVKSEPLRRGSDDGDLVESRRLHGWRGEKLRHGKKIFSDSSL